MKYKFYRYLGKKFGRLTAVKYSHKKQYINRHKHCWLFLCDCGNTTIIPTEYVMSGDTKSCGCYRKDLMTKHGLSTSRFHNIWEKMFYRCYNPKSNGFIYYGKRRIKICMKWKKFKNFRDDMYKSYLKHANIFGEKNTTIDRINNNGNYELKNCRWATWKIQSGNKRKRRTAI